MADNKNRAILTPSRIFIYGTLVKNPILVQVIGLCPAVAACADIYVATVLSTMIMLLLVICETVASSMLKKATVWVRMAVYFVIGLLLSGCATLFCEQFVPQIANTAGIYLPLMAASSAAALRCENFAVKKSVKLSFLDALANGMGTALVLLFSGFVRGLLGVGMIGNTVIFKEAPISGLAMPFGGFIILGFSAAILKWFISVFLSDYSHDMSFGIKRSKKKKSSVVRKVAPAKKAEAENETVTKEVMSENTVPTREEYGVESKEAELPSLIEEFDIDAFLSDDESVTIDYGLSSFDSILEELSVSKEENADE